MLHINPGSSIEAGLRRRRDVEGDLWRRGLSEMAGEKPADLPIILEAITETFLKKEKLDSSQLAPHQLAAVETGKPWKLEEKLRLTAIRKGFDSLAALVTGGSIRHIGIPRTGTRP